MLTREEILRLYDRIARELLAFFMRRTGDPHLALDLLADTFLIAFAQRDVCRAASEREQAGWLYRIACNQLVDHYRHRARERTALGRLDGELRAMSDAEADAIERLANSTGDFGLRAVAALGELSDEQQEAIRLRVIEERSYAEVSARLGVSEPAVRARVSRGLRALRQTIDKHTEERP